MTEVWRIIQTFAVSSAMLGIVEWAYTHHQWGIYSLFILPPWVGGPVVIPTLVPTLVVGALVWFWARQDAGE